MLTAGKVWGEDSILGSVHLQSRWCARAMNYLETYMVSRDLMLNIASAFPTTLAYIRRMAIRMAVRRQFILAAKLIQAEIDQQKGLLQSAGDSGSKFERALDRAMSCTASELRLQNVLTERHLDGDHGLVRSSTGERASIHAAMLRSSATQGQEALSSGQEALSSRSGQPLVRAGHGLSAVERVLTGEPAAGAPRPPGILSGLRSSSDDSPGGKNAKLRAVFQAAWMARVTAVAGALGKLGGAHQKQPPRITTVPPKLSQPQQVGGAASAAEISSLRNELRESQAAARASHAKLSEQMSVLQESIARLAADSQSRAGHNKGVIGL